ncbi:helix-turn-helix domain-containing protein [bacterium]|nr:helix-turn-helix domain-containing protein [bacterium]
MGIGEHISQLRKSAGMTQGDLAQYLKVTSANVSNYELGKRNPPIDVLIRLCNVFGVTPNYLLDKPESALSVKIPVLGNIPAGVPVEMVDDIIGYEDISLTMTKGGKEYFGLLVRGKSMEPKFEDGDTIICLKTNSCHNGDSCVVMVNSHDATFKQVTIEHDGILLSPLNPAYQAKFYSNDEIEALPVRILGVAVELRRRF